jgi:hypothetical protein
VAVTEQATLVAEALPAPGVDRELSRSDRWSARLFGVAVVVALPLLLWFGRHRWFFLDEWMVLMRDGLTSPGYLDAHNGHWITVLRFDYRLIFELGGLHSYVPYQIPVVLAHLSAAVLLRQVIRRLGVRGWIATCVALAFLFFGSGRENIVWGFQLSVTGSVVCGLALFLFADGPRSVTRRDWLALGIGLVGLMTSAMFLGFLVGFGVMTLLRRGIRASAFYALPLGVVYGAWYLAYGRDNTAFGPLNGDAIGPLNGDAIRYAGRMFWATFDALALGAVGAVLVAIAALGLGVAIHRARRSGAWAGAAAPLGFAMGWVVFAGLTALGRASALPQPANASRYVHVGAAMLLPLVALGVEWLARRRTLLALAALAPLAIGLPHNLDRLSDTDPGREHRQLIFATAHSPFIDDLPPDTKLFPYAFGPLDLGWLARQAAAGRIPEPDAGNPVLGLDVAAGLALAQQDAVTAHRSCPQLTTPLRLTLQPGDHIDFTGAINVTTTDGTHESHPRTFLSRDGTVIEARAGPIDVVMRPPNGQPASVCAPRAIE